MSDVSEFVSSNSGFLLTLLGICTGCFGGLLGFILKSRCSKIKCCCVELERDVLDLSKADPKAMEIVTSKT